MHDHNIKTFILQTETDLFQLLESRAEVCAATLKDGFFDQIRHILEKAFN